MRPDEDDFAAIVIAQEFELIDGSGNVVGGFVNAGHLGVGYPALRFWHNTTSASEITWNRIADPARKVLSMASPNQQANVSVAEDNSSPTGSSVVINAGNTGINFGQIVVGGTVAGLQLLELAGVNGQIELNCHHLVLNASTDIALNGRAARLITEHLVITASAGVAPVPAGLSQVPGATVDISCVAGDIITVTTWAQINHWGAGTINYAMYVFVNHALVPLDYPAALNDGIISSHTINGQAIYSVPSAGIYTIDIGHQNTGALVVDLTNASAIITVSSTR